MTQVPVALDASSPADFRQWVALWEGWPSAEVWAHPAYVRLFAAQHDRVVCAALQAEDGGVLFPMIMRPIRAESWAAGDEPRWDVVTAYGYGGAFAWGGGRSGHSAFWAWVENWLTNHRVVASFHRLGLFDEQLLPEVPGRCYQRDNVVRSTEEPLDAIWRDYAPKVRKNVSRARAGGLTCSLDEPGRELDRFLAIYEATMQRRQASAFYYFTRPFFERLLADLPGQYAFFHVVKGHELLASELVLVSRNYVYSFLGGTDERYFELRPNDLLKHSVIEWAHETGRKAFVLGGGAGPNDGILRYKLSFAPSGSRPFYTSETILDTAGCDELVRQRRDVEAGLGRSWNPRAGFFPAYRA